MLNSAILWGVLALGIVLVLMAIFGFCIACTKKRKKCCIAIHFVLMFLAGAAIIILSCYLYFSNQYRLRLIDCGNTYPNFNDWSAEACDVPAWYFDSMKTSLESVYTRYLFIMYNKYNKTQTTFKILQHIVVAMPTPAIATRCSRLCV